MKELLDAIRAGDLPKATELLNQNPAWANAKDEAGLTPIMMALYARKPEIVALIESRGVAHDIFSASAAGRVDVLQQILEGNRSHVKLISYDGWTPLHLAAFFGQTEAAKVLFNAGAEINALSTKPMKNTPLHAGAAGRHLDVIRFLVDIGANVNARQHGGWTPLQAAAQSGDGEIAEILLAAGADIAARAENGQTAMDLALGRGHQNMVEILEKHGASSSRG